MSIKALAFLSGMMSLLIITKLSQAAWALLLTPLVYFLVHISWAKLTFIKITLVGIFWASINVVLWSEYASSTIPKPTSTNIEGYICGIPLQNEGSYRFDFCLTSMDGKGLSWGMRDQIQLTWGNYIKPPDIALKGGQSWKFAAKLRPPHGRYNPAGFDAQKWMLSEGYAGNGYIKKARYLGTQLKLSHRFHHIRQRIFDYLNQLLIDDPNKGLIFAITLGERDYVTDEQWQQFKNTGTSHLLAISGLHIGIAALWCYWLTLFLWRLNAKLCLMIPAQKAAQISSLIGAFSLLLMSGMGLPAQRAFLMLAIFLMSRWCGKNYRLSSVLSIALVAILIIHPFAILSASFWLSFFAIFIIGCIINQEIGTKSRWQSWLKVNWYLYLALIPISLVFFNLFSPVSIIANLLLIPVVSFVLTPMIYMALLIGLVSDYGAAILLRLSSLIIDLISWLQSQLISFDGSYLFLSLNLLSIFLLTLLVAILLMPQQILSRALLIPVSLMFTFSVISNEKKKSFEMIVFDIGQGLAVYVSTPDGNLLYDTGWGSQDYATASSTLLPFFEMNEIKRIDKLIVSHGDTDHSGGLDIIRKSLAVGELITGEKIPRLKSTNCHQYQAWQWGEIKFNFLPHLFKAGNPLQGNNASCVLSIEISGLPQHRLEYSRVNSHDNPQTLQNKVMPHKTNKTHYKILLTGDIEKKAEKSLLVNGITQYDVIVAPHHGSKTSSTAAFVKQVKPKEVIFSTGYDNQWQFPRESVVKRYLEHGSNIWVTHQQGAIIVKLEQNGLSISSWRQEQPHFWLNHY